MLYTGIGAVDGQLWNGKGVSGRDIAVAVLLIESYLSLENIIAIVVLSAIGELTIKDEFFIKGQVVKKARSRHHLC